MSTEDASALYADLDLWPTRDAVLAMAEGQVAAAEVVRSQAAAIAAAAEAAAERLRESDGRLIYIGAGTSGRIAVQDGVELGPTFGWERLVYALAGGSDALLASVEGAEDDAGAGAEAIERASPTKDDVAIGVAASGRTPYAVAALRTAATAGALTIGIASNPETPLLAAAEHPILLETGPEIVAGSTRMKAGTAQKIVLNLLSTAIMVRLGRVHGSFMVSMQATNAKLRNRAVEIVGRIAEVERAQAETALARAKGDIRLAVLIARGATPEAGADALRATGGNLRSALAALSR